MLASIRHRPPQPGDPAVVMGVLNVTPDSFSDGGMFADANAALAHAEQMIREGAAIIDVGPESTRPGAEPVPADEQIRRSVPVIERIRSRHPDVCISIDTRLSRVAQKALRAGADWINDVSALRDDPELAHVVAQTGAVVILMHMLGTPKTMQQRPEYGDVVAEVSAFLSQRVEFAGSRGIPRERIAIDPGLGFGKAVGHNFELLRNLRKIVDLGLPVAVGASRKSFIGRTLQIDDPRARLAGSLACAAAAILAGAKVIRAHDVLETVHVARMCEAIGQAGGRTVPLA